MMFLSLLRLKNPFRVFQSNAQESDKTIWWIVVLLWLFSILIVYSAAGSMLLSTTQTSSKFLITQLGMISLGFCIVYITHRLDYLIYLKYAFSFYWICIGLLILTLFFGIEINGAKRWLDIPLLHIKFQPSDLAKIAVVLFLSKKISQNQKEFSSYKDFFQTLIVPIFIMSVCIMPENLSTALLISINGLLLLFIGRVQIKYLIYTIGIVFILPLTIILLFSVYFYDKEHQQSKPLPTIFQVSRLPTWIKRVQGYIYDDKQSQNYQIQQANIAIAKGGLIGVGPGNSEQRYFLPSSYADYVYSIWIEEYGLVGAIVILGLYLFFFYRSVKIFHQCTYAFGGFVVVGLSISLVFQALVNIGVNVNLIPNTGVTLPLISMGGTSYLTSCFGIGVILSVAKHIQKTEPIVQQPISIQQPASHEATD